MQDDVLPADVAGKRAVQFDADRGRHLEPGFPRRHPARHVRRTDPRGKRAERPVRAGVAVRADHEIARRDQPLLREEGVLHAAVVPHLEIMDDPLLSRERAARRALRRRLDVLVRREMVGHDRDLLPVENARLPEVRELPDRHGGGDVVPQHEVEVRHDQLPRPHLLPPRVPGEDLLRHRHSHRISPFMLKPFKPPRRRPRRTDPPPRTGAGRSKPPPFRARAPPTACCSRRRGRPGGSPRSRPC